MNVAYIFTFFLAVVVVLFLLMPFIGKDKSSSHANPPFLEFGPASSEDIPLDLGRNEPGYEGLYERQATLAQHEMEIEVAVKRARHRKSTFATCSGCGHQLQANDRFCASCGLPRQSL